jgi:Purple acid Phosphatase, N-terminal domain/Calcineurin-like phosphoesterase
VKTFVYRLLLLAGFVAAVFLGAYSSAYLTEPPAAPDYWLHQPGPTPDRIILTWAGDPATTQAVTWRTSTEVTGAVAQIALSQDGPAFQDDARTVSADTELLVSDLGAAHYHSALFGGLSPNTMYAYRVGDGTNWSEWNQFTTASDRPDPLTFLYVGDAQNDIFSLWSRVIRTGYSLAPNARFIIHAGDLINRANRDAEWGEWFRAAGWINATLPSVPAPGNHEYATEVGGVRRLTRHWRPQFALPQNGVAGLEESNYYLDIQGVRVVVLNSNEKREEQAQWLDALLSDNPNRWTVCTFHHPIFSAAESRDNKELRELWQPVFDRYRVDLVLQGHDHTYARSNLLTGVNVQVGEAGTVYVVSVSGPKMYKLKPKDEQWWVRAAEDTQLYQVIHIDGDRLSYESHTARGHVYDAFELQKREGMPNELIDHAPATPERRRGAGS